MKKTRLPALALSAALFASIPVLPVAAAAVPDIPAPIPAVQSIAPHWISTNMVVPMVSISGTEVTASVLIDPKSSDTKSSGTLFLEKKSGTRWYVTASWAINEVGTVSMSKTYTGTAGVTYRTRVIVTTGSDSINVLSSERTA